MNSKIVDYAMVWYSELSTTHEQNFQIDWKFWNTLVLWELCHKNNILDLKMDL